MKNLSAAEALPSLREILNAGFKDRRKIVITIVMTMALFFVIAMVLPHKYEATTSLLVLPSAEYASKVDTGSQVDTNASLSRYEILPTEMEILGSPALHADVIRKIGLQNIYPKLAEPPSALSTAIGNVKSSIKKTIAALTGRPLKPDEPFDPNVAAAPVFNDDLSLVALKDGSIIQVSYRNVDAEVAANALNTLVELYLEKRKTLYADNQSETIKHQITGLRAQLETLDQATAAFKLQHSIYDFPGQRTLLLGQRGDLEKDLADASNLIAQLGQRIPQIQHQLATTPVDVTQYSEMDYDVRTSGLQTSLNALLAQKAALLTQFKADSRPVQDVVDQITAVQASLDKARADGFASARRVGRNNNYDLIQVDLSRAEQDLKAAQARHDIDVAQLASIGEQLDRLSGDEAELDQLTRQTLVAEQSYEDAVKRYDLHKEMEELAQRRATNVRPIEPAVPPLQPTNLTMVILAAGLFVSLIVATIVALISEGRRPGIVSPEKLERTLGLTVLVSIPEGAFIAEAGV